MNGSRLTLVSLAVVGVAICAWMFFDVRTSKLYAPKALSATNAASIPEAGGLAMSESIKASNENLGSGPASFGNQNSTKQNSKIDIVGRAWSAPEAAAGLKIAEDSGVDIEEFADYLYYVRGTCRAAMRIAKINLQTPTKVESSTDAEDLETKRLYFQRYCGDFAKFGSQFTSAIKSFDMAKIEQMHALSGEIITASEHSPAAAAATIDEIVVTRNPQYATAVAWYLIPAVAPTRPLAHWQRFLPGNLTDIERVTIFGRAGERVACLNNPATCAAYTPLTMMACSGICRPGEDLLAFRRRTTPPMHIEASERIAAEMLKQRTN